jgi:hypothetical protein
MGLLLVASFWVQERQHTGQTMFQVMAAFRKLFKSPLRRATLLDWEKRAFALGSVKKRGRDKNVVFWSKKNPSFTQELKHNPPHVMIWTCSQRGRDSNQVMVVYWSVYGDFSPNLYMKTVRINQENTKLLLNCINCKEYQ